MCTVSMVGDFYQEKFQAIPNQFIIQPGPTKEEFEALRKEVLEMKELLRRAKKYDEQTGQKDCEMSGKIALLKKVAELVGVSLDDLKLNV